MPVKIIIIHGLNNNQEGFYPLASALNNLGYETEILCLPGHGEKREECKDPNEAMKTFDLSMKKVIQDPYSVIAFSQGALYLQLWLGSNPATLPKAQILLSPALFIRQFNLLNKLMSAMPSFMFFLSQTPKRLRRYNYLFVWEYRNLFQKAKQYENSKLPIKIPSLVLIDPKDEVVDAQRLKEELVKMNSDVTFEYFERPYLKGRRPGKHHILFNPEYFTSNDWKSFMTKIDEFLKKTSSGV